ncbi:MAG: VOC family protein [Actinobacteria bacterium]|nr:VOC family protein [Actinomycetota bacterium]
MTVLHLSITLDCADLELVGSFWSEALDFKDVEREGDWMMLRALSPRSGPRGFTLQKVPEPKQVKNRMHFDVVVDDVEVEVERLGSLGASVLAREAEPTTEETVVMADPEGNEFCVIRVRAED